MGRVEEAVESLQFPLTLNPALDFLLIFANFFLDIGLLPKALFFIHMAFYCWHG
jgi:hypothetical protein